MAKKEDFKWNGTFSLREGIIFGHHIKPKKNESYPEFVKRFKKGFKKKLIREGLLDE